MVELYNHFIKKSDFSNVSFANHILILNLAVADFLMGIYLLSISIVDTMYSGIYCLESVQWLSSDTCRNLGVLLIVSSQASVTFLTALATVRLITIVKVSYLGLKPYFRYHSSQYLSICMSKLTTG